jgi:hypothetical protein
MNAWVCDRCGTMSRSGDIDDPPSNWRILDLPVRGTSGARSTRRGVLCDSCDDALYEWFTQP